MQRPNARPSACEELSVGFGGGVLDGGDAVPGTGGARVVKELVMDAD